MTWALDSNLALLQRKENAADELPLAVARFRDSCGAATAVDAMRTVTQELVQQHGVPQGGREVMRVARLCELCGLSLEGGPVRRPPRNVYSSARSSGMRTHSGTLHLHPTHSRVHLPAGIDYLRGRAAVAHEIGHYLIHRRAGQLDLATSRLSSSPEEEGLSEYAARLLLMPKVDWLQSPSTNLASRCFEVASNAKVTVHAAAARLGDPDSDLRGGVRAVILWRLHPELPSDSAVPERMTPQWHLCSDAFIPVRRCHAREGSLIAELASGGDGVSESTRVEPVAIGSMKGSYRVDARAWGSVARGTRLVLAVFVYAERGIG